MDGRRDAREAEAGNLQISDLKELDLLQAHALIRLHEPEQNLQAWRCRVLCDQERGTAHWAVVRDMRGYMHAVFRYAANACPEMSGPFVVTDLYVAGPAKRHALTAIKAWTSNASQARSEPGVLPSGWRLIVANTSEQ